MADDTPDIEKFVFNHVEEGGVIGSYVVVAEVVEEDGVALHVVIRDGTSPWTALGMLTFAESQLVENVDDYDDELEEGEF